MTQWTPCIKLGTPPYLHFHSFIISRGYSHPGVDDMEQRQWTLGPVWVNHDACHALKCLEIVTTQEPWAPPITHRFIAGPFVKSDILKGNQIPHKFWRSERCICAIYIFLETRNLMHEISYKDSNKSNLT